MGLRVGRGFDPIEKIGDLNVQNLGQFNDRRQRWAAFATEDLRQMALGEIRLKIEAVQRAVFLDYDLT